jgi:hypothetical protein
VNCFRFRLFSSEMEELGEFETIYPTWSHGDEFLTSDGRWFRIVGVVPLPQGSRGEYTAYWKVEPRIAGRYS